MRIIVHIGHYKTGTTSLQRRFTDHREALAEQGVVYPDLGVLRNPNGSVLPSHSALVFEMLQQRELQVALWYRDLVQAAPRPPTLASMTEALHAAIADAGDRDVLLSSEELMRFGAGGRHEGLVDEFADLLGDCEVRVFCHLRRPDLHLPSWYNQMVKLGARPANLSESIDSYFDKVHVDYAKALRPWVQRFGADNVVVHRYERRQGDVTDDLLGAFGHHVTLPPGSEVWDNVRFPDVGIETLRTWNHLHPTPAVDARFRKILQRHIQRDDLQDVSVEFLTPGARRRLHRRCVEMAADLDALLGRSTGLFDDLDQILVTAAGTIRDIEANERIAPAVLSELVDAAHQPRTPVSATGTAPAGGAGDVNGSGAAVATVLQRTRHATAAARASIVRLSRQRRSR